MKLEQMTFLTNWHKVEELKVMSELDSVYILYRTTATHLNGTPYFYKFVRLSDKIKEKDDDRLLNSIVDDVDNGRIALVKIEDE